jgi:hypothetical protein
MLRNFKSYFFPSKKSSSQDSPTNEKKDITWVYIWKLTSEGVGHSAIQVGGDEPKILEQQSGLYASIWPNSIPSIGPTIMMSLPAEFANTLAEDMSLEASSKENYFNDSHVLSKANLNPSGSSPTQTFKISGLDTKAMEQFIEEKKAGLVTGSTTYQLLPKIGLSKFLREGSFFSNLDPIDINLFNKQCPQIESIPRNCTTVVMDVLNKGGMRIKSSLFPWGLTPNNLADQIQASLNSKSF